MPGENDNHSIVAGMQDYGIRRRARLTLISIVKPPIHPLHLTESPTAHPVAQQYPY